jgi:hypothetical protein
VLFESLSIRRVKVGAKLMLVILYDNKFVNH